jgi:hypothetical protein
MTKNRFLLVTAITIAPLAGCIGQSNGGTSTPTPFFDGCGDHCTDDDWRLAAGGAHTTISVRSHFTEVRSSDDTIVQFVPNGAKIEAFTGVPGTATLEIVGTSGEVVHRPVVVEAAAKLDIKRLNAPTGPVRVLEGTPQIFHVITTAADGQVTRGDGAVQFDLSGTLAVALVPVDGDAIAFTGTPGQGRVVASCPSATASQDVTVVATADISSLSSNVTAQADGTALAFVGALSADGPVYAGACVWSGMAPSVKLADQVPASIDFAPTSLSTFVLDRPGSYTATCTMAGRSATVTLTR